MGAVMRVCLRLMGLDVLDFTIETDPVDEAGDSTTYPVGFTLAERPGEYDMPDRSAE
jgi:hypothetical protein